MMMYTTLTLGAHIRISSTNENKNAHKASLNSSQNNAVMNNIITSQ